VAFRKYHLLFLSIAGGALLSLGWPARGFAGLLFTGLIPFLFLEDHIFRNPQKFIRFSLLFYSYPGFFTWNFLTTWWIVNSTFIGALLAIVLNSLFMSVVFQIFHWTRKRLVFDPGAYIALICYWVAFEYLHLNWDLNWPWLNLGNGFSHFYKWVQWYEFTGTFGGTLWIFSVNILVFYLIKNLLLFNKRNRSAVHLRKTVIMLLVTAVSLITLPIILSYYLYYNYTELYNPVRCVVVQPNLDPYSEQYNLPPVSVVGRIMQLAATKLDSTTQFLIAPESAIQEAMWENDLSSFSSIRLLREAVAPFPALNTLVGGSTFYQLHPDEPLPRWARKFTDSDQHYVAYNTAIMINSRDSLQLYHKSKLTPGVEILPSFKGFKWLENYAIDLGGTVGSLGMDSERKVYRTVNNVPVSAAICYESIFGEFFSQFVRNGAQLMMIITNDGWWGNTAGHRQHFAFAHLRAIETRRSIARSANTGISAFIDQRGDAHQVTAYWEPAGIAGTINSNETMTFYVRNGDYIARLMLYPGALFFLVSLFLSIRRRFLKIPQTR
jgi:apolipoprotein N-acyltransferase